MHFYFNYMLSKSVAEFFFLNVVSVSASHVVLCHMLNWTNQGKFLFTINAYLKSVVFAVLIYNLLLIEK